MIRMMAMMIPIILIMTMGMYRLMDTVLTSALMIVLSCGGFPFGHQINNFPEKRMLIIPLSNNHLTPEARSWSDL